MAANDTIIGILFNKSSYIHMMQYHIIKLKMRKLSYISSVYLGSFTCLQDLFTITQVKVLTKYFLSKKVIPAMNLTYPE